MSKTSQNIIDDFLRGDHESRSSNLFVEKSALYSYGYHFPLAVWHDGKYHVNTDKVSVATARQRRILLAGITLTDRPYVVTTLEGIKQLLRER